MAISPLTKRCFHVGLNVASFHQLRGPYSCPFTSFVETGLRSSSLTRAYCSVPSNGKASYLNLQEAPGQVKIEQVFLHTLANVLSSFNIRQSATSPDQKWDYLQQHLLSHHNYKLSLFDPVNDVNNLQALLGLFQKPLIKESKMISNPTLADYMLTPGEVFLGIHPRY